ncbi:MAG: cation:proton antiporter [Micavibrio sp.]
MEAHAADLSQIAVVLAAAFAGGSVLKRFGQPVIVGYILVGMILGPSVLGLVKAGGDISFLSELGILLLLFVIGLELDVHRFTEVFRVAALTALLQILAGLSVIGVIGWFLDWEINRIILLSFAVSLSSTAVGLKLLEDMGETDTPMGRMTMGILVAQDLAVIPMLLVISALNEAGTDFLLEIEDVTRIVLAMAFMMALICALGGKDIGPFKFSKVKIPTLPDSGQNVIVALTMCFTAAALSGSLGLSASYGAFLAGLVIGSTHKKEAYEENIRPIFELLMMIFFLSVGIMLDFGFIMEHALAVIWLLFALLFIKTIFNITILRRIGLSRRHAIMIGATLGQAGEFSFVLAALGLSSAVIYPETHKYIVTIIALSLILTPLWTYVMRRMDLLRRGRLYRLARIRKFRQNIGS